jgi:hypothetical protein
MPHQAWDSPHSDAPSIQPCRKCPSSTWRVRLPALGAVSVRTITQAIRTATMTKAVTVAFFIGHHPSESPTFYPIISLCTERKTIQSAAGVGSGVCCVASTRRTDAAAPCRMQHPNASDVWRRNANPSRRAGRSRRMHETRKHLWCFFRHH